MKLGISALIAVLAGAPASLAYEHMLRGLEAAPGTDLNTNQMETPEQRHQRELQMLGLFGTPLDPMTLIGGPIQAPAVPDTLTTFVDELYSPMKDAKCFNDKYVVPNIDRNALYSDYKKIFDWGLQNPSGSPLYQTSSGVTSNRFPSMCLRMAFHDNAIVNFDADEYVASKIDPATGRWTGDYIMLESSGGDASVLTCKPERIHPNQNYDQTASRILHAFQSSASYPQGPGIGSGQSLMSKYQFSYADALHNCALAALRYMIEPAPGDYTQLQLDIPDAQKNDLMNLVSTMKFGRKDACYVTNDEAVLYRDSLGFNSRRPLCGQSDFLPGVTLSASGVSNWFESRGMLVGTWLSLFGTHTALDNFMSPRNIRNFGIPDQDYFEDYVGCPFHKLHAPVTDPEDGGCSWTPTCKNPSNTVEQKWNLVQSDCSTSITLVKEDTTLALLRWQMENYIAHPGSWIPDITCALKHLSGNNESCAGPNSVTVGKTDKFGSFWKNDYPAVPTFSCPNYQCPANSSPQPNKCIKSFADCTCASGYSASNGSCVSTASKYSGCTKYGYSLSYCQATYGPKRHLTEVPDIRQLLEDGSNAHCAASDYDMYLVVRGAHFAGLATPVVAKKGSAAAAAECPSVVFHAESKASDSKLEKIALLAEPEHVEGVGADNMLHLGVKSLQQIVDAFENAPVGRDGTLFDAISNNCVGMLRNMADPLEIPVDARMIGFVSGKLLEGGNTEHIFDMMKDSPTLSKLYQGGRRMLKGLTNQELLTKVIQLYV